MNAHITGSDLKAAAPAKLTIGGKEYEITMDFNVLCEMEERYGSMDKAGEALSSGRMKDVRFILYAILSQSDESLTEKQVGHMLTMQNMQEVMNALGKAMKASVPESNGDEKNALNPPEA